MVLFIDSHLCFFRYSTTLEPLLCSFYLTIYKYIQVILSQQFYNFYACLLLQLLLNLFLIISILLIIILNFQKISSKQNPKYMLSSTPSYIKCYKCKKSPKQFTFLLCNHIICGQCISKSIQTTHKFSFVKCPCSSVTYFNEDNQIVQNYQISKEKQKKQVKEINEKSQKNRQRKSFNLNQEQKQFSKTLINQRSTMPILEVSSVFSLNKSDPQQILEYRSISPTKQRYLNGSAIMIRNKVGTQKTAYDESLLLQNEQNLQNRRDSSMVRAINQFSTHYINENPKSYEEYQKQNINKIQVSREKQENENKLKEFQKEKFEQLKKQIKNKKLRPEINLLQQQRQKVKNRSKNLIHSQFQSEVEFLSILFQKDYEQLTFYFQKLLDLIRKKYQQIEDQLRSLYIEQVITNQSILTFSLSQLVKRKYQTHLGIKLKQIKNQLLHVDLNKNQNRITASKFQQNLFETFHKNFKQKQNSIQQSHNNSLILERKFNNNNNNSSKMRYKVNDFQTVEQRIARIEKDQSSRKQRNNADIVRIRNQDSSKRIQTQNIHTHIKKGKRSSMDQNERPTRCQSNKLISEEFFRMTQKPNGCYYKQSNRLNEISNDRIDDQQNQQENMRRHIIYYSPPLPYCEKHFKKRSKQAKNYISYIEKLCHQKKMKNNRELFKRVKQTHPYDFKNRD